MIISKAPRILIEASPKPGQYGRHLPAKEIRDQRQWPKKPLETMAHAPAFDNLMLEKSVAGC
jgi:hypothetical protein